MKSVETGGWEPITDCPPTDNFICNYSGNFSQHLLINRGQIDRFLDIASLDGRVLLQESKVKRPQTMPSDVNPDGSVAGRGSLRWGQKLETENKKQNPYFQVEPDPAGWVISVNGNLIAEDLMKKDNLVAREVEKKAAAKINGYTRIGLRETVLKAKFAKPDLIASGFQVSAVIVLTHLMGQESPWTVIVIGLFANASVNWRFRHNHINDNDLPALLPDIARRTLKSKLDYLGLRLEIDRVLLADGYLDFKKYTGNPLIRVAD